MSVESALAVRFRAAVCALPRQCDFRQFRRGFVYTSSEHHHDFVRQQVQPVYR
jgi:hypothetical protein